MCNVYALCNLFSEQALVNILQQKDIEKDPDNVLNYLRPFRIMISLLDKSEIGKDMHINTHTQHILPLFR